MKQFIFQIKLLMATSLFLLFIQCRSELLAGPSYSSQLQENPVTDSLLMHIEKKIQKAFVQDLLAEQNSMLDQLGRQLAASYEQNGQNLFLYWQAYLHYYEAIFYLQNEQGEESEKAILTGIALLYNLATKNSEDYALLAMMQSFSIQFVSSFKAAGLSAKVKKNAEEALLLEDQNLRAAYVLASNDYYTPKAFGGGKETEKYLTMALEMPDQVQTNPYLPSWGREETYDLLIRHYIKEENWAKAKEKYAEGHALFPNSYRINQLSGKLIGQ